jgi:hypothetical protein
MNAEYLKDRQLLDEVIATLRNVRARAPQEFLVLLAVVLGFLLAILILITLLLQDEFARNILLNFSSEIFGAWLTVVLIDGLWRRFQRGSLAEYDLMAEELERRKTDPLTPEERQAWNLYIELIRQCEAGMRSRNLFRLLRAIFDSWYRVRRLEAQGNLALSRFGQQVKAQVEAEQRELPVSENEYEELVALRNEILELRKLMEQRLSQTVEA